jgi:beta-lactamase class D
MPAARKSVLAVLALLGLLLPAPLARAEDRRIAAIFEKYGVRGTMVVASPDGCTTFVHDRRRALQRYPAASTFKVLNTMIAVETGAVSGKEEVVRWDGRIREIPDWNRDQSLESAFRVSCVWYYQELARRVGAQRYREYVDRCAYGRLSEPFDVSAFWLDGSLTISAMEQVRFLRRLRGRELPFGPLAYSTLCDIMVVEHSPEMTLRAKSGWAARSEPQTGWYVGWVEARGRIWLFALNMDIDDPRQLPLRQRIAREALEAAGAIAPQPVTPRP